MQDAERLSRRLGTGHVQPAAILLSLLKRSKASLEGSLVGMLEGTVRGQGGESSSGRIKMRYWR